MQEITGRFVAHPDKGEVSSLYLIPAQPQALLVFGHGAGAGMRHSNMEAIAQAMAGQGIASFRYQFPYMERGGGRDSQAVSLATVHAAISQAHQDHPNLPLYAGGHSFGGRMTSLAIADQPRSELRGLVFASFPLHAPGKPGIDRAAHLPAIGVPMLFLTGTRDTFAQPDLLRQVLAPLPLAHLHWLETGNHGYKILKRTRSLELDIFEEMAQETVRWTADHP